MPTPIPWLFGALILLLAGVTTASAACTDRAGANGDCVVLLHGLGRTSLSMKRVEFYLRRRGYRVINAGYPTAGLTAEQISDCYLAPLLKDKVPSSAARIHFVTHSQGGIILRQYLSDHRLDKLGRGVMLAPPNHGSEIVDRWKTVPVLCGLLSVGARELGTADGDLPQRLGPIGFECGVIAGDRSLNPFSSALLPGPNDGKVTVAGARADGVRDFIVLHSTHTWLMWRENTLRQTSCFLGSGSFDHGTR